MVLVDKNGDGKADEAVTFYQGPEMMAPIGICVAPYADGKGQRVYVCQSPDILVFEDKDGDLKADGPPKKFLTGFGGFDHDHGVHGINIGPDGKLYFTVGDRGVKNLQASDGKGRKWSSNNSDCQAGTVWRCDQDGTHLELIAHNFRNNYEACVDSFGEIWLSDNDDDGNQQTRICYVMPGGNYGYGPRGAGQSHWHEEQPGIVHKAMRTGFGSPTGITFYEGSLLPEKYRGHLLHCDAGPREVRCFHIKPEELARVFELEQEVTSADEQRQLLPPQRCLRRPGRQRVCLRLVRPRRRRPRHGRHHKGPYLPAHTQGARGVQGARGEAWIRRRGCWRRRGLAMFIHSILGECGSRRNAFGRCCHPVVLQGIPGSLSLQARCFRQMFLIMRQKLTRNSFFRGGQEITCLTGKTKSPNQQSFSPCWSDAPNNAGFNSDQVRTIFKSRITRCRLVVNCFLRYEKCRLHLPKQSLNMR